MTRAVIRGGRYRAALAGGLLLLGLLLAAWLADRAYPVPPLTVPGAVVVVAADGTPLRSYPGQDGIWRYPVTAQAVAPAYLEALLAYEDRWFRVHPGVNPVAMARAGWQWLRHGRIVSGGSTLTMQVARLVDPALAGRPSRSLRAKVRQVLRAVQLEWHYDKSQILAAYLNRAPMGGIVEGVEMGARLWLGKSSATLSHAEAALLVALPQAPSRLRPDRHPQLARQARDKVLSRMATRGVWQTDVVADARLEPVVAPPLRARWLAPLAAQRLLQAQRQQAPGQALPPRLASTLDAEMQRMVEQLLLDRVDSLPPQVSMAALVMENDSLAIRAYAGSADFSDPGRAAHVDMVRAIRSPGSTLKPFLYGLALDDGLVHAQSLLLDLPLSFDGYAPGNFQAAFSGQVSVSEALQRSLNVPAVDLLHRYGAQRFASTLRAGGLTLRLPAGASPNLSLILGGGGTSLEDLVGAYRALARGGMAGRPRLTPDAAHREAPLMSAGAAWIIRDILETGGHPERPWQAASGGPGLAWKTGTSFGFRDAWAVGVTEGYTLGVWVGRPDGTPNPGFFGANVAAPLLRDLAAALPVASPRGRVVPPGVSIARICWPSGRRQAAPGVTQDCPTPRTAWVLDGTVPPTFSGYAGGQPGQLALAGIVSGAVLRPLPGQAQVHVQVHVLGAQGPVWWLLDGRGLDTQENTAVTLVFERNGPHIITVMDRSGRYERVAFQIAGIEAR